MKNFNEWQSLFNAQKLNDFTFDESGNVWLKIKSLMRRNILAQFIKATELTLQTSGINNNFKELYSLYQNGSISTENIDSFLYTYNSSELSKIENEFSQIETELYKLQEFCWGGDATNSLDKQIVSFVKEISNYDEICNKIDNEISTNTRHYTLNSWYNNWTTILTEHIFKTHPKVLSAVGKIKSVDFFIDNIPVDLKITYFPKEYLKSKRRELGLGNELSKLKTIARQYNIGFDNTAKEDILKYQIVSQIKDLNNPEASQQLQNLHEENLSIIASTEVNKQNLIKWLYENQGAMRFGAENRLFLILIDENDIENSWKLKRNFNVLKPKIKDYLDNFDRTQIISNPIRFTFGGVSYTSCADCVFIRVS